MRQVVQKLYAKAVSILLFFEDIIAINLSPILALWFRFDLSFSKIPMNYLESVMRYALIHTVITLGIFYMLKLYNSMWQYASTNELIKVVSACTLSTFLQAAGMWMMDLTVPLSYFPLNLLIFIVLELFIRFSFRAYRSLKHNICDAGKQNKTNVMIIGAGSAGSMIIREIKTSEHLNKQVVCIIDDNPAKWGKFLYGCRIVGGREKIAKCVKQYHVHEIIVAIPTASKNQIKEILNICNTTGRHLLTLPGIFQLINGEVSVSKLRDVNIEDLLGRNQIIVDLKSIMDYVSGKVVLVTGGGGSIGSELCRQIAAYRPKQLIIFDIYENNAYDIQQELKSEFPQLNLTVLIGDIQDERRVNELFSIYKPNIVYHAAAHKHVPLMEDSPNEAIKNNVFGTYTIAMSASRYGAERFVLISTDKAVNPSNIMGASKRICEMLIQTLNYSSKTEFVAVRFGNVLGSNGSVVPLFNKQIKNGGPVTVTHPNIMRYFMTIPEAVSLVLQAGAYAKGGEIFVLDMGEPVLIRELAEHLIRISGYEPYTDIKIQYTGLRPGEKLFEEILMNEEGMQATKNKLIYIGKPIEIDKGRFLKQLSELKIVTYNGSPLIHDYVREMVPTYKADIDYNIYIHSAEELVE